jgi:hypothetical protein
LNLGWRALHAHHQFSIPIPFSEAVGCSLHPSLFLDELEVIHRDEGDEMRLENLKKVALSDIPTGSLIRKEPHWPR